MNKKKDNKNLELYIHIPFCNSKCYYCDFTSGKFSDNIKEAYMNMLLKDIKEERTYHNRNIKSIYIGGGTPSSIKSYYIGKIVDYLNKYFNINSNTEISIEVNPESVTRDKINDYKKVGINRISMGAQSFNDKILKNINRIHNKDDIIKSAEIIRDGDINNLNIDLIYGLPEENIENVYENLRYLDMITPDHISLYSLIIEEGTNFSNNINNIIKKIPKENDIINMENIYYENLKNRGYNRYEISNFSKKGRECVHNLGYWDLEEYLGFGVNASSYLDGARSYKNKKISDYIKGDIKRKIEREKDINRDMEEFIFMGLRKVEGISKNKFLERYKINIEEKYGEIFNKYENLGFMKIFEDRITFTEKGMNVSNSILIDFINK